MKMLLYPPLQDDLTNAGATFKDQEVVVDRNFFAIAELITITHYKIKKANHSKLILDD